MCVCGPGMPPGPYPGSWLSSFVIFLVNIPVTLSLHYPNCNFFLYINSPNDEAVGSNELGRAGAGLLSPWRTPSGLYLVLEI